MSTQGNAVTVKLLKIRWCQYTLTLLHVSLLIHKWRLFYRDKTTVLLIRCTVYWSDQSYTNTRETICIRIRYFLIWMLRTLSACSWYGYKWIRRKLEFSLWITPVMMVRTPFGQWEMVNAFSCLNAETTKMKWLWPFLYHAIEGLTSKGYSKIDLSDAFFLILNLNIVSSRHATQVYVTCSTRWCLWFCATPRLPPNAVWRDEFIQGCWLC